MTSERVTAHDDVGGRAMNLIGGRRVSVADLLDAGLIEVGTKLRFKRTRVGRTYDATVTDKGRIRLEPGGEEFRTPSRAATAAARMRAVDGWRAWLVVDQDRYLDAVRQELLDRAISAAAASAHRQTEDEKRQRIHKRLRQAREHADQQTPESITVRELLSFWGATGRGDQVSLIEADLANHGLVTNPSFWAVTLDTVVSLTTPPDETEETTAVEPPETEDLPGDISGDEDDEEGDDLNVRPRVGNLTTLDGEGFGFVSRDSSITAAITKMVLNDFSQLAVLSGRHKLVGAVTWRSIAEALHHRPDGCFADAIDRRHVPVAYDRDLFEILPTLQQHGFVFVSNQENAITAIVTTHDVVQRYGVVATPFFQLGEVDQTLRWVLNRAVDIATVEKLCNRKVKSFDELSMGDYKRVLENEDVWSTLGWNLHRPDFITRLDEIRLIRNKVMHFHPDPIGEDAVEKLQLFNTLLHQVRVLL